MLLSWVGHPSSKCGLSAFVLGLYFGEEGGGEPRFAWDVRAAE